MKVIFDYMGAEDAEKTKCASFVFKREARKWWEVANMGKDVRQ